MSMASWLSEEYCDDKEDLVGVLESYTRQLEALCGGLEVQGADETFEDVEVGRDTLSSLEEVTGECAELLRRLEDGENGSNEEDDDEVVNSTPRTTDHLVRGIDAPQQQQPQEEELHHREKLVHELDNFADELNEFLSCLEGPSKGEGVSAHIFTDATNHSQEKEEMQSCIRTKTSVPVADTGATDTSGGKGVSVDSNEVNAYDKKEVFSDRTKKAITLHVKRLTLQKQRRCGAGTRFWISTKSNANQDDTEQEIPKVKIVWSKYQNKSFQQHIMRQKFARHQEQQIQEDQRCVESARLKGTKPNSYRRSKPYHGKLSDKAAQRRTYLNQFKPSSVHPSCSSEIEPRYLCAVYLYKLRRLGTTFVTFSSLAQFEQRVRARFGIKEVVSIYREVTEVVIPERALECRSSLKRHVKRLQRVSSLRNMNDGDTLCVTQNAYDDMTILCDWIKRRQRIVHGFQYELNKPQTDVSSASHEESTPTKLKTKGNTGFKVFLWDSNGRSIGVKPQHGI